MKIQITFDDGSTAKIEDDGGYLFLRNKKNEDMSYIGLLRNGLSESEKLSRLGMIISQEAEFIYQRTEEK